MVLVDWQALCWSVCVSHPPQKRAGLATWRFVAGYAQTHEQQTYVSAPSMPSYPPPPPPQPPSSYPASPGLQPWLQKLSSTVLESNEEQIWEELSFDSLGCQFGNLIILILGKLLQVANVTLQSWPPRLVAIAVGTDIFLAVIDISLQLLPSKRFFGSHVGFQQ
eukprot:2114265-Amphidinium_carterae.2